MVPIEIKVECWSEFRQEWVDADISRFTQAIEYFFWVSKWVREGQQVRVTIGEPT